MIKNNFISECWFSYQNEQKVDKKLKSDQIIFLFQRFLDDRGMISMWSFFFYITPSSRNIVQYIYTNKIRVPFYSIPTGNETKRNTTKTNWNITN